jgi:hypothetical protein
MEVSGQLHFLATLSPTPGLHRVGWVGPSAGLDIMEWRRIYCPGRESNHISAVQRVA